MNHYRHFRWRWQYRHRERLYERSWAGMDDYRQGREMWTEIFMFYEIGPDLSFSSILTIFTFTESREDDLSVCERIKKIEILLLKIWN